MQRPYADAIAEESGVCLRLRLDLASFFGHPRTELGARTDAELAVDARQVGLDGLGANEGGARDLAVGQAGGREFRDAQFGGCELSRRTSQSDASELGARLRHPGRCAQPLEDLERLAKRVRSRALLLRPPVQAPLDKPRPGEIERQL